ncbi:MAG: hypothetical protein L3J75_15310 [Methylococcaceae bacterium]|nr:hypothetical protein [Methylococcaceae bacterium]
MDAFFKSVPALLAVAAKSLYGILGLMVIATAVVASILFDDSTDITKLGVIILFLVGIGLFVYAIPKIQQSGNLHQSRNKIIQEPRFFTGKIKLGLFTLFFAGIFVYAFPVLHVPQLNISDQSQDITIPEPKTFDKSTHPILIQNSGIGNQCTEVNPSLKCLWIR